MSTLPERLKEFRAHTRLSQQGLADRAGVEQVTISQMERGRSKASFENVAKIIASFPDLNPDWFLNGTGAMLRDGRNLKALPTDPTLNEVSSDDRLRRENEALREQLTSTREELKRALEQLREMTQQLSFVRELVTSKSFPMGNGEAAGPLHISHSVYRRKRRQVSRSVTPLASAS